VYAIVGDEELKLDLYRPQSGHARLPVVMTIHGGSWQSGSRGDFVDLNHHLAAHGYVVAAIDYRLAPRWRFPAAQDDLAAAISYVKTLAERASLDPSRIALIGRSAGGQVALLAAYTTHDPAIRGVVSFYGPVALRWGYENPAKRAIIDSSAVLEMYLGGPPATHAAQYEAAEPARFVDASTPPTLFIQGLRDELVSPFHNEFVSARLIDAGVPHFILRLPWAVHGCDYIFSGSCGQLSTYAVEWFLGTVMR
jgi:acetyl esterase/lipase